MCEMREILDIIWCLKFSPRTISVTRTSSRRRRVIKCSNYYNALQMCYDLNISEIHIHL